jgi:hypothetical protein
VASFGEDPDDEGGGAWLRDPDGIGPRLVLLDVPERKVAKNRLHIDVRVGRGPDAWPRILTKVDELVVEVRALTSPVPYLAAEVSEDVAVMDLAEMVGAWARGWSASRGSRLADRDRGRPPATVHTYLHRIAGRGPGLGGRMIHRQPSQVRE